jgi:hypothetical protein
MTRFSTCNLSLPSVAFLALMFAAPTAVCAQSGSFTIAQNGKQVGTATVTFAANANGYDTTSVVKVSMQGLNYSLSKTEELTSGNALRHVQLNAAVNNAAVTLSAAPSGGQILLDVSANGRTMSSKLEGHPAAVFLPDFDPGALDTLLALAVSHNNRGLWAILPKKSGTQNGSTVPIQLATYADEKGTLNGKAITVHHLEATIAGSKSELFSGPGNQLLQAELPQQAFAVVRNGFVLTPPTKAGAPPQRPQASAAAPGQPAPAQQAPAAQAPPQAAPTVQQ